MSKELIEQIKNVLALQEGVGIDDDTKAVAGGGVKRLSIKGGVFRKMLGNKEVATIPDRHMNVVFVKMAHNASRTFYTKGWKEGENASPACWATDGRTPDAEVARPVSDSCDKCPMSAKGSGPEGRTACRVQWRTAVVLPNDIDGDVMQFVIPAQSCFGEGTGSEFPFRPYIQYLAGNSISAGRVVTKMRFDTDSATPKLFFSPVAAVDQDKMSSVIAQGKSPEAENAVKMNYKSEPETAEQTGRETVKMAYVGPEEDEEGVAPAQEPEPVVRTNVGASTAAAASDVPDIISKWSKKQV